MYLHTDDTACPEEFRETKRMNTDFFCYAEIRDFDLSKQSVFIYPTRVIRVQKCIFKV